MFEQIDNFTTLKKLQSFGPFDIKEMLGGLGLFKDCYYFGAVVNGQVYLRANASSLAKYQAAGCQPLTTQHDFTFKNTYSVPANVAENSQELCSWAAEALAGAKAEVI